MNYKFKATLGALILVIAAAFFVASCDKDTDAQPEVVADVIQKEEILHLYDLEVEAKGVGLQSDGTIKVRHGDKNYTVDGNKVQMEIYSEIEEKLGRALTAEEVWDVYIQLPESKILSKEMQDLQKNAPKARAGDGYLRFDFYAADNNPCNGGTRWSWYFYKDGYGWQYSGTFYNGAKSWYVANMSSWADCSVNGYEMNRGKVYMLGCPDGFDLEYDGWTCSVDTWFVAYSTNEFSFLNYDDMDNITTCTNPYVFKPEWQCP